MAAEQTVAAPEPMDPRRRRALYRAGHRGTKEMDWMLGRFADAMLPVMGDAELMLFEQMLAVADPDINNWLLDPASCSQSEFAELIGRIRVFHGLDA